MNQSEPLTTTIKMARALIVGLLVISCVQAPAGPYHSLTPSIPHTQVSTATEIPTGNPLSAPPTQLETPATTLPMPTVTQRAPVIATLDWKSGKPMMVVLEDSYDAQLLSIIDLRTGLTRELQFAENVPQTNIAWSPDSCTLVVALDGVDGNKIVRIDPSGNILEEIFATQRRQLNDGGFAQYRGSTRTLVYAAVIAPFADWIAYPALNNGTSSAEVEVVSTDDQTEVYRFAERGGACVDARYLSCAIAWSPDGSRLTYSGYDENGVKQLYVAKPDGTQTTQITFLSNREVDIFSPRWSPDGENIAFGLRNAAGSSVSLEIVPTNGQGHQTTVVENLRRNNGFWWHSNTVIAAYVTRDKTTSHPVEAVQWIEIGTYQVIGSLLENEAPNDSIIAPWYFSSDRIGFFSEDSSGATFYVYDMLSQTFERQPEFQRRGALLFWSVAPTDASACRP